MRGRAASPMSVVGGGSKRRRGVDRLPAGPPPTGPAVLELPPVGNMPLNSHALSAASNFVTSRLRTHLAPGKLSVTACGAPYNLLSFTNNMQNISSGA